MGEYQSIGPICRNCREAEVPYDSDGTCPNCNWWDSHFKNRRELWKVYLAQYGMSVEQLAKTEPLTFDTPLGADYAEVINETGVMRLFFHNFILGLQVSGVLIVFLTGCLLVQDFVWGPRKKLSEPGTILGAAAWFIPLALGITAWVTWEDMGARERLRGMRLLARQMRASFTARVSLTTIPDAKAFHLLSMGRGKDIQNMLAGQVNGNKVRILDYEFEFGSGEYTATNRQAVIWLESDGLNLPYFSLRPGAPSVINEVMSKFRSPSLQDVGFEDKPIFSSHYRLRGSDRRAIRQIFSNAVISFYENNLGLSTDGGGHHLFIWRDRVLLKPHDIPSFVRSGLKLLQLFQDSSRGKVEDAQTRAQ